MYLYRLNARPTLVRDVFRNYFISINHLKKYPEWYNALAHNCTTAIRGHAVPYTVVRSWPSWKLLVNSYLDGRLYEVVAVDQSLSFPDLKARSHINARAQAAGDTPVCRRKLAWGSLAWVNKYFRSYTATSARQ